MSRASASGLIRWSGLALAVSGVPPVVATILHPNIYQTGLAAAALHTPTWTLIHLFAIVGMFLTLIGLTGLYARQADRLGALGLIGLLLVVPGIAAIACLTYAEAAIVPVLATEQPRLLAWDGPLVTSGLLRATAGFAAAYAIGLFLLGLATLRARVLPRRGAIAVVVGTPAVAIFAGFFVPVLDIVATALLAAGFLALGWDLWSSPRKAT